jgi:MFS family permease
MLAIRRLLPPLLHDAPDFRRIWAGQTISVFGDEITRIAVPLVAVLILGADAAQMGSLTAAGLLPHLLLSLVAGVWLDRVRSRRRLMIWADLGRAVLLASIPVAFAMGTLSMAQLYVVGFLVGSLTVIFDVAWNTVFVATVARERFVEAMALLNGSRSLASVAGPSIGGVLVQVLGAPIALIVDALSFLGSAIFLRRVRATEPPVAPETEGLRERFRAGLAFVLGDPIVRPVLLSVATVNLFSFANAALVILYATNELGVSPGVLGLAFGAGAIGGVLGALIATRVGRRMGLGPAYALGLVIYPLALLLIPAADGAMAVPAIIVLLFASEFGAGLGVMILDINVGAILSARYPDRLRSRATGAFRFINYGVRPIGALLGGALGTAIGVRETLLVTAIAGALGVLFLVGSRILRLRDLPEVAD